MGEDATTNVAFTPYEISLCLFDVPRTRMWKEAIEDVVEPGDVVVDAGSGTGILGVFAALAGAKQVYCIELHPRFVTLIQHLAERNNVSDRVHVVHADASKWEPPEPVDVVIAELLCTGQFFEPQVQVMNHLRGFLRDGGRTIPRRVRSTLRLLDAQEMIYGVQIDCDSRSLVMDDDEPVSSRVEYDTIDFSGQNELWVDTTVRVEARHTRIADAVLIEGQAELAPGILTHTTKFLYNPEVIFLPQAVELEAGKQYDVRVRYPYGGDTLDATFEITPV